MVDDIIMTNRALAMIGARSQITGFDDGSQEGIYAGLLYEPIRDFLLREGDYDFSLNVTTAVGAGTAGVPWVYSYSGPNGALRVRSAVPLVYIPLDPKPVAFNIMTVGSAKFVWTREAISQFISTVAVAEDLWDSMFVETFLRMFGSALAFALESRAEVSNKFLQEAMSFAGMSDIREG